MDENDVLAKAWAAVQASGVPESLYKTAFKEAVALIAGTPAAKRVAPARPYRGNGGGESQADGGTGETAVVDTDALMQTIADEAGIDVDQLIEFLYFDSDGTPHINVPARRFGSTNAAKSKAIATTFAAVAYFGQDEPSITLQSIRAETTRLKAYDENNFAAQMKSVPGTVLSGSGTSRVLKVKDAEIKAALRAVVSSALGSAD